MCQGHHPTTLQQRLEIWERAQCGESDPHIAATMQLSVMTVRKWRRRAQREGRGGLASHIGRPKSGVLGTATPELRQVVRELRVAHPGWGPITLRLELAGDGRCAEQRIPSRSRLAAFIKAEQLTRRYDRHTQLIQPPPAPLQAPHDEWEMDAQGVRRVTGVGRVSLINVGDPYSHLRAASQACLGKTKPDTADYQLALRRAFLGYGRPKQLSLDHDTTYFDSQSASPFPSRLHLWLIALGIGVRFIRLGRPTDHAFIERTHEIVDQQVVVGQVFAAPNSLQSALDQRLEVLNQRYPCRTLDGRPPLVAYPAASHSGRPYRPEHEAELLDLQPVYHYLAQHHWFRQVSPLGQFSLGGYRYGLGKAWANQTIEITFERQTQEFVCQSADGQRTQRVAAKGLTKADLMGELAMEKFPHYQYAFPWALEACRRNLLHAEMTGTTL